MIPDGASLMIGGFMGVGTPERLIDELVRQGKRDLTVIANDTAMPGRGIGKLVTAKLVRKAIASHIGLNPETQQKMLSGEIEVELVPQGTLIERIRAAGYGLGRHPHADRRRHRRRARQAQARGRRSRVPAGNAACAPTSRWCEAFLADYLGNLTYALTARNFNPVIAMAAKTVIVDASISCRSASSLRTT